MKFKGINNMLVCLYMRFQKNDGFGMNELLGIAATLIIAAFVIIPGLRTFADNIMDRLGTWWTDSVTAHIFPVS
jgi:hypothetical protein